MEYVRLDCRGMTCPDPILKTKEIIDRGDVEKLIVSVDNASTKENVGHFLLRMGFDVAFSEESGCIQITGTRRGPAAVSEAAENSGAQGQESKIAVIVGTDRMGKGDDILGRKLVFNFISTLKEMGPELWRLIFLNGGVKLAVDGSECLPALQALEGEGIHILVCGTCLNHFGLLEKKRAGETTNMLDIVTALQVADKVISVM